MRLPHKGKNKGKYISFHYLRAVSYTHLDTPVRDIPAVHKFQSGDMALIVLSLSLIHISSELTDLANGSLEGCYYISRPGFNLPEAAAYGEVYSAEYNVDLEAECLYGNDGVMWIKQAIEEAGSDDPAAIRDALENTDSFDGLLGHMSVDPATHNPSRDAAVFTIKDDTVEYVGIYEPDEAE